MGSKPILTLASSSPRRRELMGLSGWVYNVRSVELDERRFSGEDPGDYVLRLAEGKAQACAEGTPAGQTIIAADTCVAMDGEILGKPEGAEEALRMLECLRGRTHRVYTGLAVLDTPHRLLLDLCITEVPMRAYSDEEMRAYVASGDPLDKAGAYAIQHRQFQPVTSLQGCYASVMGLPLCHLVRLLQKMEITPAVDIPGSCQAFLNYPCSISPLILCGERTG